MTKLQVTQLSREPDAPTRTDCKVIPNQYVFDVWCYGTSFHSGCRRWAGSSSTRREPCVELLETEEVRLAGRMSESDSSS